MRLVLLLSLTLVLYNNLLSLVPQGLHNYFYVPLNLAAMTTLVVVAWRQLGVPLGRLGFSRGALAPGVRWGGVVGLALVAPLFLALAMPATRDFLADPRVAGVGVPELAYRTLVRIPLGTALFEEVAFRGVLYGLWLRARGLRSAVVGSSVVFGLWHIAPTLELLQSSDRIDHPGLMALAFIGGIAATGAGGGGLLFAGLRWKTGGVYGPALAHGLINALATLAAYLAR